MCIDVISFWCIKELFGVLAKLQKSVLYLIILRIYVLRSVNPPPPLSPLILSLHPISAHCLQVTKVIIYSSNLPFLFFAINLQVDIFFLVSLLSNTKERLYHLPLHLFFFIYLRNLSTIVHRDCPQQFILQLHGSSLYE